MSFKPLKDINILDCSIFLPGPYCTMMLAEMGASVVKVERAGTGEPMRTTIPGCFDYLNGNKKFVTLNLKHQKGKELFLKMAQKADVIVEGFRPGTAKRLGIDFDTVKKINPSIIYCSISGHGQNGPYAKIPGHDINYQGLSGLLGISGNPDSGTEFPDGFQAADLSGSMFALVSILAALNNKDKSPVFLDIAISESLAMWMMPRYFEYLGEGKPSKSKFMGRGPYGIFEAKDGKYITIGVVENHFWDNLCKIMKFDDLASDPALGSWHARNHERAKIVPRLKVAIKEKDSEEWIRIFTEADIPVAPVCDFENWQDNPQFKYNNFIPTTADGSIDQNIFRRFPLADLDAIKSDKPEDTSVGKDNVEVMTDLGMSGKDVEKLKDEGVI